MSNSNLYPDLSGVINEKDVSKKGGQGFAPESVSWSKVRFYLRTKAPGWQPFAERTIDGGMCHTAPDGTFYLLIGFRNQKLDIQTETVPHAVMDNRMQAKKNPDARDISDAYVRGLCKAAALLFGLGWQLWSKDDPFERDEEPAPVKRKAKAVKKATPKVKLLRTFANKGEALKHLDTITTEDGFANFVESMKGSQEIANGDRAEVLGSFKERQAIVAEGNA